MVVGCWMRFIGGQHDVNLIYSGLTISLSVMVNTVGVPR